jgi:hypothetical protein
LLSLGTMAFRQHHRPQASRQISFKARSPSPEVGPAASVQRKRPLVESEEWVLFSPVAPSTIARTHTTSTDRTARTAGLSHLSDFGSLDTAARSQDDDAITYHGTEEGEELDSLDDGLHAFHEPSDYGVAAGHLQQSGETVLPTHDGLGAFQPDATMQEHLWQFERRALRRPHVRRRSSVQRRLDALESNEEVNQEQERRQRIENWRLEQSRALLEEIERESRRRRRMSIVSAARSCTDGVPKGQQKSTSAPSARSASDVQSVSSDESSENLSFWERLTRRVIRGLMGIDEDTLSVIFGESLAQEAASTKTEATATVSATSMLHTAEISSVSTESWEQRLLERAARELGILVSQLSEHPGAFSTYRRTQETPEYVGQTPTRKKLSIITDLHPATPTQSSPTTPFAPTFPAQQASNAYSEASLWGIEEEPEVDPLDSFRTPPQPMVSSAEDSAREHEYWERELDVKMVFNFLLQRFSSRRPSIPSLRARSSSVPSRQRSGSSSAGAGNEALSARRAAVIRQHHPLVGRADRIPTSSMQSNVRDTRRKDSLYRQQLHHPAIVRNPGLRSSSSCASQSTKKSKHSKNSARNYWDLGGSVGSGSVLAAEV